VTGIDTVHMSSRLETEEGGGEEVINPNAPVASIENTVQMRNVIGLAFGYQLGRYFFTDIQRGDIQSVQFDGSDYKTIVASKVS